MTNLNNLTQEQNQIIQWALLDYVNELDEKADWFRGSGKYHKAETCEAEANKANKLFAMFLDFRNEKK